MTTFGVPNTFSPGQTPISSAQVNANFAALVNALNSLSIPTTPVTVANGGTGSTTAQAAITALGLAIGTIIPATCSYASGVFSITGLSSSPTVQSYQLGTTYLFVAPANESATSFSMNDVTSSTAGLGSATLYDSFGNLITSVAAGQVMIVTWNNSTTAPGFSLVNLPPPSTTLTARFAQFTSTGTWTAPSNVTQAYFSGCGGGGAGGACSAPGNAGGGGGGGAACVEKQLVNVVPGQTYSVTIGAAGAGATGAAGGAGGLTQMESASFVVLVSCPGGAGGSEGTNASPTPGGAAGGAGGVAGQYGYYLTVQTLTTPGCGGGSLFGSGGSKSSGVNSGDAGQAGAGYGAGGGGGSPTAAGGNGSPGYGLIEW
jgi:hypothetical protein